MRYLTKSRYKLAEECPVKLFYTRKEEYPDKKSEDPFLVALAEGGFQVGVLAKYYFPGGTDITTLDYNESCEQTNELLSREHTIVYEAAIRFENLFIRADVLVKNGNKLYLYEVKAKSCDFDDESGFLNNSGLTIPGWQPYVDDVAFQKYVITRAFPQYQVFSYLILVDKTTQTSVDGLNQKFQLVKNSEGRTSVNVIGDTSLSALGNKILISINVDNLVSRIWNGTDRKNLPEKSFQKRIWDYALNYSEDTRIDSSVAPYCWNCEFYCTPEEELQGFKSGFKECIKRKLGWNESHFQIPSVMEIWGTRRKSRFFEESKFFMHQLVPEDLGGSEGIGILSSTDRQWLQVQKFTANDHSKYLDKEGLAEVFDTFNYPLHFIDFETSMVAIPFHKNRRPYEQIAFQFSHHIMDEKGNVNHVGQYISTNQGEFPNYNFLRALKKELENDQGTIFRYAAHENTVLNQIHVQLLNDSTIRSNEREELQSFIRSITTSSGNSVETWDSPRSMVDMLALVKGYYYDPLMQGSNSIKNVLPAALQTSEYIQEKYSNNIYGKNSEIQSLNFEDGWIWIQKDEQGKVINPYKLLPNLFDGVEETEDFLTDNHLLADGGAAMTAYMKMQFTNMSSEERISLIQGLLRYCELDTLAMVMIFEAWREWIKV